MDKPPYRVPGMSEIAALPWNGMKVASTFSGCGGSCLGYRMAGFRVVWANEFVPAAQASYAANSDSYLDCRDIKHVQANEMLDRIGLKEGELDVFDGSPPCQAFSTAGKREKGWGKGKKYEHGAVQCNETLFSQYIRILRGLMPRAFIAENVSGLVKGTAKGYFLEILRELKASGYRVACRVLDAQWLGVPQTRQRVILMGIRNDLNKEPAYPKPLPYRYSVRDALPWVVSVRQDPKGAFGGTPYFDGKAGSATHVSVQNGAFPGKFQSCDLPSQPEMAGRTTEIREEALPPSRSEGAYGVQEVLLEEPCPTVTTASPGNDLAVPGKVIARRKFTIAELKRICGFPDDFILKGSYAQQWERLGNSVPPVMMSHIAAALRDNIAS